MAGHTLLKVFVCVLLVGHIQGDIYMHNPRGSNNRLDEAGRNRRNANRMFDSQNNDRGGYNVGSLYYYSGSRLPIEWTNQHSCNSPNSHCELIIQYMCHPQIRDGSSTTTIPFNRMQCENYDCNTDRQYGMQENYQNYLRCTTRERNKGLFLADQDLRSRSRQFAKNTRQNPKGTRRGYECPEERDYYPYWHPSPWIDVAVMTNDVSRCNYYRTESQNVKSRWECVLPETVLEEEKNNNRFVVPNTKEECEEFRWPANGGEDAVTGEWREFPAHGVPAPDCRETEFSRDNHLGNTLGGQPLMYNWSLPNLDQESCALRIRYNISTGDYDNWSANASLNKYQGRQNNQAGSLVDMGTRFGFPSRDAAEERGYVFKNNPEVELFPGVNMKLRLAINTAQLGRTFQDRSHSFAVRPRPAELQDITIHNLNVRGKRGNIVQVYPGVEYDFVPNTLEASLDDYVHFQWTGSNTNPRNNDGQGLAGTDRSNVVLLGARRYPEGSGRAWGPTPVHGQFGLNYPMHIRNTTFLGFSRQDITNLAFLEPGQFRGEMSELDDAGTYFDLGPKKITSAGTYHYMCTRNNNFSNRDQKGRVIVYPFEVAAEIIGNQGGFFALPSGAASLAVQEGAFEDIKRLRMEEWEVDQAEQRMASMDKSIPVGDEYASKFLNLMPNERLTKDGQTITVDLKVDKSSGVSIYHADPENFAVWTKVEANFQGDVARLEVSEGGVYVARAHSNAGTVVGVVIACLVVAVAVIASVVYFRRNPDKWNSITSNLRKAGRSTKGRV